MLDMLVIMMWYYFSILKNTPLGAGYEIINLDALKKSHKLGSKKHRSELVSLFIYENQKKFKIQEIEPKKEFQRPDLRLTVDNPEDLLVARMIHEKIGKFRIDNWYVVVTYMWWK